VTTKMDYTLLLNRPKGAHLAVVKDQGTMTAIAAPPGCMLVLVWGDGPQDFMPLILVEVGRKKLVMTCACRKPDCSFRVTFTGKWTGRHPKTETTK
jgi:hypothetical protein